MRGGSGKVRENKGQREGVGEWEIDRDRECV